MNIGFDGKRAVQNMTGLGNYSRTVVATLSAMYPDNRYILMAPRYRENPRIDALLRAPNVELFTPQGGVGRRVTAFWRSVSMPEDMASLGLDIYHGLSNELPLTARMAPCPTVVTVHDLIWRRYPADYPAVDRWLFEQKYRRSARLATRIIAVSERTKQDMVELWRIPEGKIDVIYQGCDPIFTHAVTYEDRERIRRKYALPERYIIAVGAVRPRKNQLLAVRALSALPEDVHLIIVGSGSRDYIARVEQGAAASGVGARVRRLEGVPFQDLPALYACAALSSYTSRYEGFGIPLVESLSVGTPAVACTGSCLEEAAGPGAIYISPDDPRAYAEAAAAILDRTRRHDALSERGHRHVARFTSKVLAEQTMQTYMKAIMDFATDLKDK